MINIEIAYQVEFTNEDINDIMATALEGGITYWCGRVEVKDKDLKGQEYASDVISHDGTLLIYDSEDEDEVWELTREKFINGLKKFLQLCDKEYFKSIDYSIRELDISMIDAEDADIIIQYALFNEIVFG